TLRMMEFEDEQLIAFILQETLLKGRQQQSTNMIISFLEGYKTYILAVLGIVYSVTGWVTGHIDSGTAVQQIWSCLTIIGLRSGIASAALALKAQPPAGSN